MAVTVLTADTTYYIRTNGVDTPSRDGKSVANAWATLAYAIEQFGSLWPGDFIVTVDIGSGVFTQTAPIKFQHPFGKQFYFTGVSATHTGIACTPGTTLVSVGATGYTSYELTFTQPVGSVLTAGDYVMIESVTGGTARPHKALGLHRVKSIVSSTVTLEVVMRANTTLPTGTLTCSMVFINTVLYASNCGALKVEGPFHAGTWNSLVFKGDADNSGDDPEGVWCLAETVVSLGTKCGVWGFKSGLYAQNNATIFADGAKISKCTRGGAVAQNDAVLNLRDAIISGCGNRSVEVFIGATAACQDLKTHSVGTVGGLEVYKGGFVDAQGADLEYVSGPSVYAKSGAFVYASGLTTTDGGAMSPTENQVGNGNAYIYVP